MKKATAQQLGTWPLTTRVAQLTVVAHALIQTGGKTIFTLSAWL
jgi:hypothetical protein